MTSELKQTLTSRPQLQCGLIRAIFQARVYKIINIKAADYLCREWALNCHIPEHKFGYVFCKNQTACLNFTAGNNKHL